MAQAAVASASRALNRDARAGVIADGRGINSNVLNSRHQMPIPNCYGQSTSADMLAMEEAFLKQQLVNLERQQRLLAASKEGSFSPSAQPPSASVQLNGALHQQNHLRGSNNDAAARISSPHQHHHQQQMLQNQFNRHGVVNTNLSEAAMHAELARLNAAASELAAARAELAALEQQYNSLRQMNEAAIRRRQQEVANSAALQTQQHHDLGLAEVRAAQRLVQQQQGRAPASSPGTSSSSSQGTQNRDIEVAQAFLSLKTIVEKPQGNSHPSGLGSNIDGRKRPRPLDSHSTIGEGPHSNSPSKRPFPFPYGNNMMNGPRDKSGFPFRSFPPSNGNPGSSTFQNFPMLSSMPGKKEEFSSRRLPGRAGNFLQVSGANGCTQSGFPAPQKYQENNEQGSPQQIPEAVPLGKGYIHEEIRNGSTISIKDVTPDPDDKDAGKGRKSKKQKRRKVTPDMPRRPLSAYNIFFCEERYRIVNSLPETDDTAATESSDDKATPSSELAKDPEKATATKSTEEEVSSWLEAANNIVGDETKRALIKHLMKGERRERRAHRKTHGKIGFKSLAKLIGKRWRELPTERVAYYKELAELDSRRYREAMAIYNEKKKSAEEEGEEKKDDEEEEDDEDEGRTMEDDKSVAWL